MGTKWNYRIVAIEREGSEDTNEHIDEFALVSVAYDEDTDKIVASSNPDDAIVVGNSMDNLRSLLHRASQAIEFPVLHTSDLPGSSDYVDPEDRERLNPANSPTFWSSGKAYPVRDGEDVGALAGGIEGDLEPSDHTGAGPVPQSIKPGAPDYSKASASESTSRQPERVAAGPGPEETDHITPVDYGEGSVNPPGGDVDATDAPPAHEANEPRNDG